MRRFVRVTDDLFDLLEALLPGERGEDGTPSIADFVNTDLVAIADYFAEHWDKLPSEYPGRDDYRTYVGRGRYVATYAVQGQLAPDGWIELTHIDIQRSW